MMQNEKSFNSISELISYCKQSDMKTPFPYQDNSSDWEWVMLPNGRSRMIPNMNKHNSIFIYRGQNTRHKPCVPSALRGRKDGIDLQINRVKLSEFKSLLNNSVSQKIKNTGLDLNFEALAQHYGLQTHHIDVTHSLNIAAFFACCYLDGNKWKASTEGTGVIYRTTSGQPYLDIVGVQIYPRPAEQMADSIIMGFNQDFEKLPNVEALEFKHSFEESIKFLEMFESGLLLFPECLLDKKAEVIKGFNTYSEKSVKRQMLKDGIPKEKLSSTLKEFNMKLIQSGRGKVTDRRELSFTNSELRKLWIQLQPIITKASSSCGARSVFYAP